MQDFRDKVAVVTGAASGIGFALAQRCAQEGMRVVLADVEGEALTRATDELRAGGATALAVRTDVTRADDLEALAQATLAKFGAVHLLFNNAGVFLARRLWEVSPEDWQWVLGVNLWGVIHGLHAFVPLMLREDVECHIVNTASAAGLASAPGLAAYTTSKHAVVALSETLYQDLKLAGAKIGVSVLCPSFTRTRIHECERNRPPELRTSVPASPPDPRFAATAEQMAAAFALAMPAEQVADCAFDAIRADRLYALPHPEVKDLARSRLSAILEDRNPA